MKPTYEQDTRPEAPVFSPAIKHYVKPDEPDATLCEEYIDTNFTAEAGDAGYEQCKVCYSIGVHRVIEDARSFVARELGVDESEVF